MGLTTKTPCGGVKTSMSVWYDTDSIKLLEKRLPTFRSHLLLRHNENKVKGGAAAWGFVYCHSYKFLRFSHQKWTQPWPREFCERGQMNEKGADTINSSNSAKGAFSGLEMQTKT